MTATGIGVAVRRKEDHRFITGKGHYTDDISRPGQAHAYFVRSPHAHARFKRIDMVHRYGGKLDEETVRHELEGNICRCTGYHNIVKAVLDAASRMKVAQAAE